ncbi:hypothetical protein ACWD4T_00545 [Streptomyces umbrinus]
MTTLQNWRTRLRHLGSARLRMALLFAALAATTLTLLTSLPAHAAPSPSPSPTAPPSVPAAGGGGVDAPSEEELEQIQKILARQSEKFSKSAQAALLQAQADQLREQLPDEGGILGVFNVTDANNLPISVYSVKSDTGNFTRWDLGLMNLITELLYMVTKWLIAFCCWLIAWALSFGLAKLLLTPVLAIANSLHTRVIMEMGLPSLFLTVCALICTARIFFGDRARGWGDAALSILLAALTTTLLSSTPQTLLGEDTGAVAAARGFSLEIADVILDADPDTPWAGNDVTTPATSFTLSRPLTDALTDAFIVRPAMLLQYGRVFEGECASAYTQTRLAQLAYDRQVDALSSEMKKVSHLADYVTPDNTVSSFLDFNNSMALKLVANQFGGAPMDSFEEQCVKGDADAAKQASLDKVGGAFFLLIAAGIVTVLIIGLAGAFLTAQCRIAWDAIRGEPALIAGTIPGIGRSFLWDWCASVMRSLGQMIVSIASLAVFILIIQVVLDPVQTDWGRELTLRFLGVDVVCIAAVHKRKQLMTRTHQISNNFRAKMSGGRSGGSVFSPSATPVAKSAQIGRKTARVLVRGALATTALAQGNPLAAVGYAMPQSVGATALMSRLHTGGRRGNRARPARPTGRGGRTAPPPSASPPAPAAPQPAGPSPQPTSPPRPGRAPRTGPPPRPAHRPGSQSARPAGARPGSPATRQRPRHQPPTQPAASPTQQQLRRRLDRGIRRTPSTPRRSLQPNRASRVNYEAWLAEQEAAELARRTDESGDE